MLCNKIQTLIICTWPVAHKWYWYMKRNFRGKIAEKTRRWAQKSLMSDLLSLYYTFQNLRAFICWLSAIGLLRIRCLKMYLFVQILSNRVCKGLKTVCKIFGIIRLDFFMFLLCKPGCQQKSINMCYGLHANWALRSGIQANLTYLS